MVMTGWPDARMIGADCIDPLTATRYWADPWFAWSRWHDWTSVYGPAWMLTTWGIAKAAGSSLTKAYIELKLVILAIDLTVMGMLDPHAQVPLIAGVCASVLTALIWRKFFSKSG